MSTMASQITSLTIISSTVYSGADQRKHQSSTSLASGQGIHRWPVNYPHKRPVTRKMFPLCNTSVIMKRPLIRSNFGQFKWLFDTLVDIVTMSVNVTRFCFVCASWDNKMFSRIVFSIRTYVFYGCRDHFLPLFSASLYGCPLILPSPMCANNVTYWWHLCFNEYICFFRLK